MCIRDSIGTGHVGSHVAFSLALQGEVDELYMMDIDEKKAKAQAMDVNDAVSYIPHKVIALSLIHICTELGDGVLRGGNMTMLSMLLGTPYFLEDESWENTLLFIEDVGEAPYKLDRMLQQFRLSGLLSRKMCIRDRS